MKTKILVTLSALAFLASACGSKTETLPSPKGLSIPESIDEKINTGPRLASQETDKLKSFFKPKMNLKIVENLYQPEGEAQEAKALRQRFLSQASLEEKDLIRNVQEKCQIRHPNKEQEPFQQEPTTGTKERSELISAMIGKDCPLQKQYSLRKEYHITNYNPNARVVELTIGSKEVNLMKVNSQRWMQMSDVSGRNMEVETKWSVRNTENVREFHMNRTISGNYARTDGFLSVKGTVEGVEKNTDSHGKTALTVLRVQFSTEGLQAELTILRREGAGFSKEAYLNGHGLSSEELQELFGREFDDLLATYF